MFGSLRPHLCQLARADRSAYRRAYCGTCKALGTHYGQLTRPLLSYDVVFVATVIEALAAAPSAQSACRCPLMPLAMKPTVFHGAVSMQVAAAVQVALAEPWFDDHVRDGLVPLRPIHAALRSRAARAHARLAALGVPLPAARGLASEQEEAEAGASSLTAVAEPTARVLEQLFGGLHGLPAMAPAAARPELAELGRYLGTAIYLLDAVDDLASDVRCGGYNPCIGASGRVDGAALAGVIAALHHALDGVERCVETIPWVRDGHIVTAVCAGLRARARAAVGAAKAVAAGDPEQSPRMWRWLAMPWRALRAMVALAVFALRPVRRALARHRTAGSRECAPGAVLAVAAPGPQPVPALLTGVGGASGRLPAGDPERNKSSRCCNSCSCTDCCSGADCCSCTDCCWLCDGESSGCCGSCDGCGCESCDCCSCDCCSCDCS